MNILGKTVQVAYNDQISLANIRTLRPEAIVISPGSGTPRNAGISLAVIKKFYRSIPILGVCLGHQAIAEALGGTITLAAKPMHGKVSPIFHTKKTIFKNVPNPFPATRYHSLIVERSSLPDNLQITAWTANNEIMGIKVKNNPVPVEGVQFHPEAILTIQGQKLLENFFKLW